MASKLSVDTACPIDLQRERATGTAGRPAHRFLAESADAELFLSTIALGEFAEGFDQPDHPIVTAMRAGHTLVAVDEQTALIYARVARQLRRRGG